MEPTNRETASAPGDPAPIETLWINSTELRVSDVERSVAFYREIFGMPVLRGADAGDGVVLGVGPGPQYMRISPAGDGPVGIADFSLAVTPFDPDELVRKLGLFGARDVRVEESGPAGACQVAFLDSHGYAVRLEAAGPASGAFPTENDAPIPLVRYSHVTFLGERAFYQRVFGMPIQVKQGPAYMLSVGAGPEFVTGLDAPPRALPPSPRPAHLCFAMEGYDPNRITGLLMDIGLKPVEFIDHHAKADPLTVRTRLRQVDWNGGGRTHPLGSYETYMCDPDNIEIQIQDVSYRGGSGINGQICP
jgi:catechol 2,3-dioxygenase-like lactoylglutathione lyase family enzyme